MVTSTVKTRRYAAHAARCLAVAFFIIAPCRDGRALTILVRADLPGASGRPTIGTLVANNNFDGHPSGMNGHFTFADRYAYLDKYYQFDWVNIVTDEPREASGLWPEYPAVDPQAPPQNNNEDDEPYYYNRGEWDRNTFADETIHEEGKFSQFIDFPNQPETRTIEFMAFLVARDIRDADKRQFDDKRFCALAGWDWTYDGAEGDFDTRRGTSTVGSSIETRDPRVVDIINAAIANEANDSFEGWAALHTCTLVPEPGTLALLVGAGFVALLAVLRREMPGS